MLKINELAPEFSLFDKDNNLVKRSDFLGKWVVIYFYPKDNTPGCTTQAKTYEENLNEFKKRGIEVIGISKDSVASHSNFASKHNLTFTLLSDPSLEVLKAYKVWGPKKMYGREYEGVIRSSYLIDPNGVIRGAFSKVSPKNDALTILNYYDEIVK